LISGTLILAVWFPLLVNGLAFAAVLLTRDTADRAPSMCHWVSTKGLFIGCAALIDTEKQALAEPPSPNFSPPVIHAKVSTAQRLRRCA
jgi:hypothetical protein